MDKIFCPVCRRKVNIEDFDSDICACEDCVDKEIKQKIQIRDKKSSKRSERR